MVILFTNTCVLYATQSMNFTHITASNSIDELKWRSSNLSNKMMMTNEH